MANTQLYSVLKRIRKGKYEVIAGDQKVGLELLPVFF